MASVVQRALQGEMGDDILRQGDPGSEAGRWARLLMVGMGLNEFKMCKSAQSSGAPRKVMRVTEEQIEVAVASVNTTSLSSSLGSSPSLQMQ